MSKQYYYEIVFPDETLDSRDTDELFDSKADAKEAALYALSCAETGASILHMSNPGDYPDASAHTEDAEIYIREA